jgi:hypothetical protein
MNRLASQTPATTEALAGTALGAHALNVFLKVDYLVSRLYSKMVRLALRIVMQNARDV